MAKKFLISLLLLAVALGAGARDIPFRSGERFGFRLMFKWGGINQEVGSAKVLLDSVSYQGAPTYHAQFIARSNKFFDGFYKIREHFHSWFDARDLRPRKFIRETLEGKYAAYNLYHYDWANKTIHAEVNMNKPASTMMEIPLDRELYDLPALIYHLRTMDHASLAAGQKIPLTFAIDDDVYDVIMTYHGQQRLKIRKLGYMQTRKFSCTVVNGALFEGNKELLFWFSDDGNRLPVAIMAPLRVGAVWAWLKNYENLIYEPVIEEQK
jgi:hypothetical protein